MTREDSVALPVISHRSALRRILSLIRPDYKQGEQGGRRWADVDHAYDLLKDILAIEAEAAAPPSAEPLDPEKVGIIFRELLHEADHPGDGVADACIECINEADRLLARLTPAEPAETP